MTYLRLFIDRFFIFYLLTLIACLMSINACNELKSNTLSPAVKQETPEPGAYRLDEYIDRLKDKNVALVINQTSVIGEVHLLDTLLNLGIDVQKVFAPEHGFRGTADAGQYLKDELDPITGIPIISLYGKNRKPNQKQLQGIDLVVFDIQDVGVRFYTYISTLHYVMDACAEAGVEVLVLDRPNPNGHYIDGPILEPSFQSFVGMHPVPIVYGMTIGEYALMIKGEAWLESKKDLKISVVPCSYYNHNTPYDLNIKPSPNLPNYTSILLYPSLCLFEGTHISVGRGTAKQFQVIGHPKLTDYNFSFTPTSREGAKHPKHENVLCYGKDYSVLDFDRLYGSKRLNLGPLVETYARLKKKNEPFFLDNNFFDKLAGTAMLREQIESGFTVSEISNTWQKGIEEFRKIREKYLLYP